MGSSGGPDEVHAELQASSPADCGEGWTRTRTGVNVLRFATEWHEPNRIMFAPEHGPLILGSDQPIPTPAWLRRWMLRYAEGLALVSDRTGTPIAMPDLGHVAG